MQIVGNLGKDAEVKEVNGKKVIEFSVAHSYKKQDGTAVTVWVSCSKWGETTAIAPYLLKGTKVWCDGIPSQDVWVKDGEAKGSLRMTVGQIELLGKSEAAAPTAQAVPGGAVKDMEETGDLPF